MNVMWQRRYRMAFRSATPRITRAERGRPYLAVEYLSTGDVEITEELQA